MPPRRPCFGLAALLVGLLGALSATAHDTFLRLDDYTLTSGTTAEVVVFHGVFDQSYYRLELTDATRLDLAGPSGRYEVARDTWTLTTWGRRPWRYWQRAMAWLGRIDRRFTASFRITPREPGPHAVGMVLPFAGAAMDPATFETYLHEIGLDGEPIADHGLTDPDTIIRERYRKSAKTLFLVDGATEPWSAVPLGHPAEFLPLANPHRLAPGDTLPLRLLLHGRPLPDQPVIVSRQKAAFTNAVPRRVRLRSDAEGRIEVTLDRPGVWWLSFTHLERLTDDPDFQYASEWATLVFELR